MNNEQAAEELRIIRQLMERPIRYSTMSGVSGLWAGATALLGAAADWHISATQPPPVAFVLTGLVWAGVFLAALAGVVVMTRIREKRQAMPPWSPVKRRILLAILPAFVAGAGLTTAIVCRTVTGTGPNEWGLIPALWMAFYGLALWQVGEFSPKEIRVLGVAFVLSAIPTAAFWQTSPYAALCVTFGGFHILYGLIVLRRYGG